jgi:Nucleotidyl transferase AbiEii toxin, Type IV TA system
VELPVILLYAEAFERPPELATIACAAIVETAVEKFVALTRRAGAVLAGLRERDPTLVRHLYDLHVIRGHYDAADFAVLAREIMSADAETYGDGFPAAGGAGAPADHGVGVGLG